MGLDMYLKSLPRKEGIGFNQTFQLEDRLNSLLKEEKENPGKRIPALDPFRPHIRKMDMIDWHTITTDHGYWCKANAIHEWFVNNVQGGEDECEPHEVTFIHLYKLREVCGKVLNDHRKQATAEQVLPTANGFFFGGAEYDEYYYEMAKYTFKLCNDLLDSFDWDNNYLYYQSSW